MAAPVTQIKGTSGSLPYWYDILWTSGFHRLDYEEYSLVTSRVTHSSGKAERFGEIYCLCLQGLRLTKPSNQINYLFAGCLFLVYYIDYFDCLCSLMVRVLGYRSGGPGSIPGTTRKKVVGLERGPLSLVSTTEELLDRKVAASVYEVEV
jgi:hypothetical protein